MQRSKRTKESFGRFLQSINGDEIELGPQILRPLIKSVLELFQQAFNKHSELPTFDAVNVRREIFKLTYERDQFCLNQEADSFEVFDFLITSIHIWIG